MSNLSTKNVSNQLLEDLQYLERSSSNMYERGRDASRLRVWNAGTEQILAHDKVLAALAVDTIIRIAEREYPDEIIRGANIVHFGLPIQGEPAGTSFALAKIKENGMFRPTQNKETQPLLSFENIWTGKILECIEQIDYTAIHTSFFESRTIGLIQNIASLKAVILGRYQRVLPDSSEAELLSKGVSIRVLEIDTQTSFA